MKEIIFDIETMLAIKEINLNKLLRLTVLIKIDILQKDILIITDIPDELYKLSYDFIKYRIIELKNRNKAQTCLNELIKKLMPF